MNLHIITIFPGLFSGFLTESIVKRAVERKKIVVQFYNPRDFTNDRHRKTDDTPYGGGPGMVMLAEPILRAVEFAREKIKTQHAKCYILSPRGRRFTNAKAELMIQNEEDIILVCGRYEGIDARVKKTLEAQEISIGPYTLTGGELPAMVMIDAITRRLPDVLGNESSVEEKRIAARSVFTKPELLEWKGKKYRVPKILLSGDHRKIEQWREKH